MEKDDLCEMSPEEINEAYMICPSCKELAEKIKVGDDIMCSICGQVLNPSLLEQEKKKPRTIYNTYIPTWREDTEAMIGIALALKEKEKSIKR